MQIFKTQLEAEDTFINGLRLVTTAKDFFKDLDQAFQNWSCDVSVEEWDKEDMELAEATKGAY